MQNNNEISILVVDDNPSHYEIVSRMIRKSSLKVSSIMNCSSYQKSQEVLNQITPDVVLLDYKLPDSSDLELISFMMCQNHTRFIPIVVITGEGNEFVAVDALKRGAMDYMVKSYFTEQVIEDTIKNAIEKSSLQKQLEFSNNYLKEQNLELRAAYNFKSQFLYNMNQETKRLLKEIFKLSKCILNVKDTDERAKLLEIFQKSNLCLSEFIKAISDYSKMECGHLKEVKEDFNLSNLLNSAVNVMSPLAEEKNIALNYKLDEEIPSLIKGDSKKLHRILLNLVSNALKFSSKDSVKICVEKNEAGPVEKLRFSITDSSSEFSKVIRHKNFDDFQQAEASLNNRFAGADIRLFLSKSIVEFMGGRIWVECDKQEVLKFIFEIPL